MSIDSSQITPPFSLCNGGTTIANDAWQSGDDLPGFVPKHQQEADRKNATT
jgi:hypothetical protein